MLLQKLIIGSQSLAVQYPEWLESNKASLSPEDYQRYEQQAQIMGDICSQFEKEGSEGTDKDGNFESILDLMQRVRGGGEILVSYCHFLAVITLYLLFYKQMVKVNDNVQL